MDGLVERGRYATRSEVLRDALRRMEDDERKEAELFRRLDASIASGVSPRSSEEIFESSLAIASGEKLKRAR
jgi:putative addiction module CopG family antidote